MIKLSNSSINTYQTCARKYYLQYVEKLSDTALSSALIFGVAIDLALNEVLLNVGKPEQDLINIGLEAFYKAWDNQDQRDGSKIELSKNPNILYTKKDFDPRILTQEDYDLIEEDFNAYLELGLISPNESMDINDYFESLQKQPFGSLNAAERAFFNYVVWLSIRRKAPYIIGAYVKDLVPHIDKVVKVQLDLSCKNEEGDILSGIADFVTTLKAGVYGGVTVEAGEVLIADNKTSGKLYKEDTVRTSSQLAKYKVVLNEMGYKVRKGAYFVVVKELKAIQNKTCTSCGHKTTKLVKKCDNVIAGSRCNGEFEIVETLHCQTQLVVDDIPQDFAESAMEEVDTVIENIKQEKFDPDYNACNWQYGSQCPFFQYCRNGSEAGLVRRKK